MRVVHTSARAHRLMRYGQRLYGSGPAPLWEWVAANPELAVSAACASLCAARIVQLEVRTRSQDAMVQQQRWREQELEKRKAQVESELRSTLDRERQLELLTRAQAATAEAQEKRVSELRMGTSKLEASLLEAAARERQLQSISARGQHGEQVLQGLLDEMVSCGYAESFCLQAEVAPGKRPDAIVTLVGGKRLVVDIKAPRPPTKLLESACEDARREYVGNLKRHISELGSKRYHANMVAGAFSRTWLLLPGEGYLQAAYAADGSDSARLHEHAADRAVMLVGPNGFRSALQLVTLLQHEADACRRMEDSQVQQRLRKLQPIWTESVLPRSRVMGKDLKKLVASFNELGGLITAFDADLRAADVLDLAKARKTSLPPVVSDPSEPVDEGLPLVLRSSGASPSLATHEVPT